MIFEGEYIKGKREGQGIEYYENGVVKFKGKYFNGKRNGIGHEYDNNGKLEFNGYYYNDKRWDKKGYTDDIMKSSIKNDFCKVD